MRICLKFLTGIVFSFFVSAASGQFTLQQKDSIAKNIAPVPGKAVVYIIRPTAFAFAIRMDVNCDSNYIGTTGPKSYLYTVLTPGKYNFLSRSENKAFLEVAVEGGKVYYLEQQVKMGMIYARTKLLLVNEQKGKKFLAKCKLDHTNQFAH